MPTLNRQRFPIVEALYSCADTSSLTATGDLLYRGPLPAISVIQWPHAEQQLVIRPIMRSGQEAILLFPKPGEVYTFAPGMIAEVRTRFLYALLEEWIVQLVVHGSVESGFGPFALLPGAAGLRSQKVPICRSTNIASDPAYTVLTRTFQPVMSGILAASASWSGAPGANAYLQVWPYCASGAVSLYHGTQTLANRQNLEMILHNGSTPFSYMAVRAGCNYLVQVSQQSGGALTLSLDLTVYEMGLA